MTEAPNRGVIRPQEYYSTIFAISRIQVAVLTPDENSDIGITKMSSGYGITITRLYGSGGGSTLYVYRLA